MINWNANEKPPFKRTHTHRGFSAAINLGCAPFCLKRNHSKLRCSWAFACASHFSRQYFVFERIVWQPIILQCIKFESRLCVHARPVFSFGKYVFGLCSAIVLLVSWPMASLPSMRFMSVSFMFELLEFLFMSSCFTYSERFSPSRSLRCNIDLHIFKKPSSTIPIAVVIVVVVVIDLII